jgi:hypothetical protein
MSLEKDLHHERSGWSMSAPRAASRLLLFVVVGLFFSVLVVPGQSRAQCPWAGTPVFQVRPTSMAFSLWRRQLTVDVYCNRTMNSAGQCLPTNDSVTTGQYLRLGFKTYTGSVMDYCQWNCNPIATPTVTFTCRIDRADGLPVELMEFRIDHDDYKVEPEDR